MDEINMRYLIIILFLAGCAKKDSQPIVIPQPAPQQKPQCEYVEVGYEFLFCKGRLCCNGSFYNPFATCSFR